MAPALASLFALFTFVVSAYASSGKVLVLLEDLAFRNSQSIFLTSLEDRGYDLEIKGVKDSSLKIKEYDTYLYEKIVLLASDVSEFGGQVDVTALLGFVDAGNDLIVAFDSQVSEEVRDLVSEVGVDVEPKGNAVIDNFNAAVNLNVDGSVFVATDTTTSKAVLSEPLKSPVLYRGVGMSVSPSSELVLKALTAPETSYSTVPTKATADSVTLAGSDITLVALVQARNNARVVVIGSLSMCSNQFMAANIVTAKGWSFPQSSNQVFCTELSRWGFHERGVLHTSNMKHYMAGDESQQQPAVYRIRDKIVFSIDILEQDGQKTKPFSAEDVQVEVVMLDPYIRTALVPDSKGTFSKQLDLPDVYGVFKFVINYKRPGYTWIEIQQQIPIRPFRHDEFERFILSAYPYYAASFSVMTAFFGLIFFVLYHK